MIKALRGRLTLDECSKNEEDGVNAVVVTRLGAADGLVELAAIALVELLLARSHPLSTIEELLDCVFMI